MTPTGAVTESVAEFAGRARVWLADNMPAINSESPPAATRDDERSWKRARELQRRLYDGGFAGICFPSEYGGLGLDYEYQKAFDSESLDYEMPLILNTPRSPSAAPRCSTPAPKTRRSATLPPPCVAMKCWCSC